MKRLLSFILIACLILTFSFATSAQDRGSLVVCGDSIAQGYGIQNPDEASYGRIVADSLGYSYKNFGHDGDRSVDLLNKLESNSNGIRSAVSEADVVLVSIGGNDFIKPKTELPSRVFTALFGSTSKVDAVQKAFAENFEKIVEKILTLNPDVTLVVNTVYNGHTGFMGWVYNLATTRVNAVVETYLEQHPGAYLIADTYPVFEGHREYIAVDTLHPSALGNVAIAQVVMCVLHDNGLAPSSRLTVNAEGRDQINNFSNRMKAFLDFWRLLLGK